MPRKRQTGGASRPKKGLTKWFAEEWVDVKTGEKCGRSGKEVRLPKGK